MGQVPKKKENKLYLIVGNGRLARHFTTYFTLKNIPHYHWYRRSELRLRPLLKKTEKALVFISDGAIVPFILEHQTNYITWIHCSGVLSTPMAECAHPLMAFPETMFDLKTYTQIPFVTEKGRKSFPELFPELSNPHFSISPEHKPLYHAWCVMSGNFTTLLWQRFFEKLESEYALPKEAAYPYLKQISENLIHSQNPLTGPLVRGDEKTISTHLELLEDDPYRQVYEAFVNAFKQTQR
tara:strand:- start:4241 stop:4957 length:717 start_codon:yes stop_codon:yes gene_type:complete